MSKLKNSQLKLPKPIFNESKTESLLQKINKHTWPITTVIVLSKGTITQLILLFLKWKLKSKTCWSNKSELLTKSFLNKSKVKESSSEEIKHKLQTKENFLEILSPIERKENMLKHK